MVFLIFITNYYSRNSTSKYRITLNRECLLTSLPGASTTNHSGNKSRTHCFFDAFVFVPVALHDKFLGEAIYL